MARSSCGYCQTAGHNRKTCPKRNAEEKARKERTAAARQAAPETAALHAANRAARAAGQIAPALPGAVRTAPGNGLDLDSLRQAHALCEQRAQQYAESAQNLKAILLLETALATATAAPPADGKAD